MKSDNMENIRKSTLIGNAIIEINRDEIDFDDLYEYQKKVIPRFDKKYYHIEHFNDDDIISFCKMFSAYVECKNKNKIVFLNREKYKQRLTKFFRSSLSSEIIEKLRCEYKVVLPILINDKIVEYNFSIINNELIKSIKDNMKSYDKKIVLDLELLSNLLSEEELNELFNNLYNNYTKKTIIDSNNYLDLVNSLNTILNDKSKEILDYILKNEKLIDSISNIDTLNAYYDIAIRNKEFYYLYNIDKHFQKRI